MKKKIYKIRNKLDKIDNKILILVKKRTQLVNIILSQKDFKNQIIDKKRIKIILKKIKQKSIKMKIDTDITKRIWKSMINAFIRYEFKNFKKK
jgi:chorismate mutase|tara:strand:- start:240 stop:518 length:279 start_codon:yes stop_codon:yes gene_type:complete